MNKILKSCPCTQAQLESQEFHNWCKEMKLTNNRLHRKRWEFSFIAQVLFERGMLKKGKRGLGFGVGKERLVSLLAKYGCKILATDLNTTSRKATKWIESNQHCEKINDLNRYGICDNRTFEENVSFQFVDMTAIPDNLTNFDFCWSSCVFEHLGSIKKGKQFIYNMIKCLKPGGIAVHTTEFNVSSNSDTVDNESTVIFRKCDFREMAINLKAAGHSIDLDFTLGDGEADKFVAIPPYSHNDPVLKTLKKNYVKTSYGLVIQKKGNGKG